jgi:succinate dehydrogenase / fumarate reductase cytochrome b subunit
MSLTQDRPVFLNLLRIRQPVTAVVSILHRFTGILMVLALPGLIYLLQISLSSPEGFSRAATILDGQIARLFAVLMIWALAHHLFAGIRFLILDFDVGVTKDVARKTAWLVNMSAAVVAVMAASALLSAGAFL